MSTLWGGWAKENPVMGFCDMNLRGAGQVFFQDNPLSGLVIVAAIFWGAYASGNMSVAFGAVAGLLVSTSMALLLNADRASLRQGLFGFNGILVGVAIPIFLVHSPLMWAYLLVGAAVSTVVTMAVERVVKIWSLPGSTAPFVFTTWLLLLAAYSFTKVPVASMGPPALPGAAGAGDAPFSMGGLLSTLCKNVSQVYLIENVVTGVLFVIAIAINSVRCAAFAVLGSIIGSGAAFVFGTNSNAIAAGLYGFSAVLTAIAVGAVFRKPSASTTLYAMLATIFTVVVQAALNAAMAPIGIPTLTFPFVLTMWIFLLPSAEKNC